MPQKKADRLQPEKYVGSIRDPNYSYEENHYVLTHFFHAGPHPLTSGVYKRWGHGQSGDSLFTIEEKEDLARSYAKEIDRVLGPPFSPEAGCIDRPPAKPQIEVERKPEGGPPNERIPAVDVRQPTGLRPGVTPEKPDRGTGPGVSPIGGPGVEVLPPEEGGGKGILGGDRPGDGGVDTERKPGTGRPGRDEPRGPAVSQEETRTETGDLGLVNRAAKPTTRTGVNHAPGFPASCQLATFHFSVPPGTVGGGISMGSTSSSGRRGLNRAVSAGFGGFHVIACQAHSAGVIKAILRRSAIVTRFDWSFKFSKMLVPASRPSGRMVLIRSSASRLASRESARAFSIRYGLCLASRIPHGCGEPKEEPCEGKVGRYNSHHADEQMLHCNFAHGSA